MNIRVLRFPLVSLFFLVAVSSSFKSSAAVSAGDIAVIGLNCDLTTSTSKTFAIVALADIAASEVIYFSDKAYYASAFGPLLGNGSEGRFSWTIPAGGVAKGTVIMFTLTSAVSPSVTTTPTTGICAVLEGWNSTNATISPFGQNGDNLLIYQGTEAAPTFIFGFNSGNNASSVTNGWQTALATNPNGACEKPASLTVGSTAVGLGGSAHFDNYIYTGTRSDTKANLLSAIGNTANWTHAADDITPYNFTPGGPEFALPQPIFTILSGTLPVHLILFAVDTKQGVHQLRWKVENETGFNYYGVEQGVDGITFTEAGQVPATGKTGYDFTVNNSGNANSYYRLKMVDISGEFTFSPVVLVRPNGNGQLKVTVSPNPFQGWVTVSATAKIKRISVTDMKGSLLMEVDANDAATSSLSLGHLREGMYLIKVKTENETQVMKIIKK